MKFYFFNTSKYKSILRDIYVSNFSHRHAINIIHDETKLSALIEHIISQPEDVSLILAKLDGYLVKSRSKGESGYVILTLDILQYFVRHCPKLHYSILEIHINYVLDVILETSDIHFLKASALLLKESIRCELFQLHIGFLRKILRKFDNQSMEATCLKFLMLTSILNINVYNQTVLEKYYKKIFKYIICNIVEIAHQLEVSSFEVTNKCVTVNSKNVVHIIREAQLIISNLAKLSHTLQDTCAFDTLSDIELATTNIRVLYEIIWKAFYSLVFFSNVFSWNFAEIIYETCEYFFENNHRIDSKIFFQIIYFIYKIYKIISSTSLSIPSKELNSHKYDIVPVEIILYQFVRDRICINNASDFPSNQQLEGSEYCIRFQQLFIIYLQAVNSFLFHWYNFVLKFDYSVVSCPFLEDTKFGNKTYEAVEKSVLSIFAYLIINFSFIQSWDLFSMFPYDISILFPDNCQHLSGDLKNYYCNIRDSIKALDTLPPWMVNSVLYKNPWNCNVINEATDTVEDGEKTSRLWMFRVRPPNVSTDAVEERNRQYETLFHTINQLFLVFFLVWKNREQVLDSSRSYHSGSSSVSCLPPLDSLLSAMITVERNWTSILHLSHSAGVRKSSKHSFRIYSCYLMLMATTDFTYHSKSASICSGRGWESILNTILNSMHQEDSHPIETIETTSLAPCLTRELTKCLWLLAARVIQSVSLLNNGLIEIAVDISNHQYLEANFCKLLLKEDILHACAEYSRLCTPDFLLPWKLQEIVQLLYMLAFSLTKMDRNFSDTFQFCWNIHVSNFKLIFVVLT